MIIPNNYSGSSISNLAEVAIGGSEPFQTNTLTINVGGGASTIADVVFLDNGIGGGVTGNGIQDGSEPAIPNVTLKLYNDLDNDGVLDASDSYVAQTQSGADGAYSFSQLSEGNYIVVISLDDPDLPDGLTNTTPSQYVYKTNNPPANTTFGFADIIDVTNTLLSDATVFESDYVDYQLQIRNLTYTEDTDNSSTVIAWASQLDPATNFNYYPNNLLGAPDAQLAWPNTWSKVAKVKGFDFSGEVGTIEKVEIIISLCLDYDVYNDYLTISFVKEDGTVAYAPNPVLGKYSTPSLNDYVGPPNIGWLIIDVTNYQEWDWDVFDSQWAITMNGIVVNSNDGAKQYTDAIGVRVTSTCCASPDGEPGNVCATITQMPVLYEYDNSKFQFISSSVSADQVSNGQIVFNSLAPLYPNEIETVDLRFRALQPGQGVGGNEVVTNAIVSFQNDCSGVEVTSNASASTVTIQNLGSVSGYVFGDADGDGWKGTTGYEPNVDNFIPGVEIFLYGCFKNNGDLMYPASKDNKSCTHGNNGGHWELVKIDTTDANGRFNMSGINNGYYYIEVDETSLTNAAEQTADPDRTNGLAGNYADKRWKNPNDNCRDLGIIGIGNDHTNINFGYYIRPTIHGLVWNDLNGDGIKDINEPVIPNVPVEFNHNGCTTGSNCDVILTNGNGEFTYTTAVAGVNYRLSLDMNSIQGADSWNITFEADGTTDNSNAIAVNPSQQGWQGLL